MLETTWNVSGQVERLAVGEVGLVGDVLVGLLLSRRTRHDSASVTKPLLFCRMKSPTPTPKRPLGDQALDRDHRPHVLVARVRVLALGVVAPAGLGAVELDRCHGVAGVVVDERRLGLFVGSHRVTGRRRRGAGLSRGGVAIGRFCRGRCARNCCRRKRGEHGSGHYESAHGIHPFGGMRRQRSAAPG